LLLNANDLSPDVTLSTDVCIIGAGAAGITLARRLEGEGLDILLVESGGFGVEGESGAIGPDPSTQALYRGTMSGIDTWELDRERWRLFGGSTLRWSGFCTPLTPDDFRNRDWIRHSGWPFGYDELVPFYERAQEVLQLPPFEYDAEAVASREGLPLLDGTGRLATHIYQFSAPVRFRVAYRDAIVDSIDTTLLTHANVTQLSLSDDHGRVASIACRTLEDNRFRVEAGRFVLATGGIENARLLLASNDQRPEGVANGSGTVGRYFMEHPHYYGGALWLEPGMWQRAFYRRHEAELVGRDGATARGQVEGLLALGAAVREEERLPNVLISATGPAFLDGSETGELESDSVWPLICDGEATGYPLILRAEQTPFEESRITLSDDLDPLGMPRVDLHWAIRDADLRGYRRTLEIVGAELAAAGLGRVYVPRDEEGRVDLVPLPGAHHLGTTRMSTSPEDGVVNADGRAHEVENLYVLGSSVFPTGGAANPTLTVVALAERLADHMLA
jgi:choline dehydrogenase-like flavoprotein